jgi:hypothetical protein
MLVRPKFAIAIAAFGLSATLFFSACSSSQPRDINWGTDVAVGWVPPDADVTVLPADSGIVDSSTDATNANATTDIALSSVDDAGVSDAGASVDASVDADD